MQLKEDDVLPDYQIREDTADQFIWETIETWYNPGGGNEIADRVTTYDNGIVKTETYSGGVRSMIGQFDNPNTGGTGVVSWDSIETYFDEGGLIEARFTNYDNGIQRFETFEDGVRSQTSQTDNLDDISGQGVKAWSTIDTYYDQGGVIEAMISQYDNGIVREIFYENGIRAHVRLLDNPLEQIEPGAANWTEISTYYDQNGVIEARITDYDSGILKEEFFEDGMRVSIMQHDNPNGGDSAVSWETNATYYDENGSVEFKFVKFDNGVERETQYDEGDLSRVTRRDNPQDETGGEFNWSEITHVYDAGDLIFKTKQYDNDDKVVDIYEEGVRDTRLQYDADDSQNWAVRVTDFSGSENVITTYDDLLDVPAQYLDMLGIIV